MPAFERISSGFGTLGLVGVIWIDSYSPPTHTLLGLAVVNRIVSPSIEMLQSGRIRTNYDLRIRAMLLSNFQLPEILTFSFRSKFIRKLRAVTP
jgi:uncharacterized membrane protein